MEIMNVLIDILKNDFSIQAHISEDMLKQQLTGPSFKLDAGQMYQLLMCVENAFHIFFTPEEIKTYDFRTLDALCQTVSQKVA